jgi:hypothetical protein
MDYKINYVPVFYIGPNRNYASYQEKFKNDPMFFVRYHVKFLNTCENSKIKRTTFVFNDDISDELKDLILQTVSKIKTMEVEVIFRENCGFSYGAWNDVIKKNLNDFDYFFLIEDDYIPVKPDFYEDFVDRCTPEYPYVSTFVDEYQPGKFCASCSNSIIRADVCKDILQKYNELFLVNPTNILQDAWNTQMNFLNLFTQSGYGMRDILHKYSTPHNSDCNINRITVFGNKDLPHILVPIIPQ